MTLDQDITVVKKYPPNIEDIKKVFDVIDKPYVYAWGDIIFNPLNGPIDEHLRIHEMTHMAQQNGDPKKWWDRYLGDKQFMIEQEIEAYSNQYNSFRTFYKDRNHHTRFLTQLANSLSGPMYSNAMSFSRAYKLIKEHADRGHTKGKR